MSRSSVPRESSAPTSSSRLRGWPLASVYFVLSAVGLVGTSYFNARWALANGGFRVTDYVGAWFVNAASSSAAIDLTVVALAACVVMWRERHCLGRRPWGVVFIILSFLVAVAFAFPLFLGLRELARNRSSSTEPRSEM